MGILKFVIPFVGGALTAAAASLAIQKKREKEDKKMIEIDAEFEEKLNDEKNESSDRK